MKSLIINLVTLALVFTSSAFAQDLANNKREKISFSQHVDSSIAQRLADVGAIQKSRVFFRKVSGAELNSGVDLTVDADQAVIQITPLDSVRNGKRIVNREVPRGMTLSNGVQRRRVDDDSIALHRKSQGLRENFPKFYSRAHAMRVPKDMGRGKLRLEANGNAKDDTDYIVYVLDKNSDIELEVQTPKTRFSRSENLVLDAQPSPKSKAKIESISSTLVAPNGKRYTVSGRMENNRYRVHWPIKVDAPSMPGELWQVEVRSTIRNSSNESIERVAVVSANIFEETAEVSSVYSDAQGLRLALDVQQPGRYETRALVYGIAPNGEYKPTLLSYQAEWFEPGQREMKIPVDDSTLVSSGLGGPYRVQNIQLLDQGRMAVLEYLQGNWELK